MKGSLTLGFVNRELARIATTLRELDDGDLTNRLYAAQQVLWWSLEPTGSKAPHDMIMGTLEGSKDCRGDSRLVPS